MDLGHLGDVILSLPALISLRKGLPHAKITVLVASSTQDLFKLFPVVDELIPIDRSRLKSDWKIRSIAKILGLVADVRRRRFDLVIDLHSLYETNILGFLSGADRRLFANRENRSLDRLSNFRPKPPKEDKALHLSSHYLNVLKPLEICSDGFVEDKSTFRFGRSSLNGFKPLDRDPDQKMIGLFVGAGHESRRWSLENFAKLTERLAENINAKVFVFLGPAERHFEDEVKRKFPSNTAVVSGLTLIELAAHLFQMDVLVSNDTGPMHLAAVAGTSVVLLLDDRAPRTYLPLTDELIIIGGETLDLITVNDVLAATLRLAGDARQ